jgi:hypothetical protein
MLTLILALIAVTGDCKHHSNIFLHKYCSRTLQAYHRKVSPVPGKHVVYVAKKIGLAEAEIKYMLKIIYKEDRFRSRVHRSGRHAGLFGQKCPVSPCIVEQIIWANKYCKNRYKSWKKAWEFHKKHNWW